MDTGTLIPGPADLAGVVRREKRADHKLARLDEVHVGAHRLDDADVLVADWAWLAHRVDSPIRPQIRAADAGGRYPDDGIGGIDDRGVVALLDSNIAGCINDRSAHGRSSGWASMASGPVNQVLSARGYRSAPQRAQTLDNRATILEGFDSNPIRRCSTKASRR